MFFVPVTDRPYIGNYCIHQPKKRVRVCKEEHLDESGGVLAIEREGEEVE